MTCKVHYCYISIWEVIYLWKSSETKKGKVFLQTFAWLILWRDGLDPTQLKIFLVPVLLQFWETSATQMFLTRKFIHANRSKMPSMDQFRASMVLSAVGDALGYKNGEWEFCHSGEAIHQQLQTLGGLEKIDVKGWIVSDDTVLHLATAEALVSPWKTREELFLKLAANYKAGMVSRIPLKLN